MSAFKGTPGTWVACEVNPEDPGWGAYEILPGSGGEPVATMVCGVDNAHLIAAAPDLLRELTHLYRCLRPWIEAGKGVPGIATLNGAEAAIAKALGGES